MSAPVRAGEPLSRPAFETLRRRAIFDCCKWDPQVEDVCAIAAFPLVLRAGAWSELRELAEALARETLAAEAELLSRPDLWSALGLPRAALRALERGRNGSAGAARLARFDFHPTDAGWRMSEANTDVPGGLNEASGFAPLVARHHAGLGIPGDPADGYVDALRATVPPGGTVALVHATAYTDDRQMMTYLARRLAASGVSPVAASPAHLRWREGRAWLATEATSGWVDLVVRFFPGEWLPNLPAACGWPTFFGGASTALSNPGAALLTQSKRFPLVWPSLRTALPTWHRVLPETRDPREAPWRAASDWVLKPALGRVGEDIGIPGITTAGDWRQIARAAGRHPDHWVAQRRFETTPLETATGVVYPCVGVYTVDGRAVGVYGRVAATPLIDWRAQDAAVLVDPAASGGAGEAAA